MSGDLPAGWALARFRDAMRLEDRREPIDPGRTYKLLGVRWYGHGAFLREERRGESLSAKHIYRVQPGDVIYNRLFAWKGSFGIVGEDLAGCYVSNEFPLFATKYDSIDPQFLSCVLQHSRTSERADAFSTGTTSISRNRLSEDDFLHFPIDVPPLAEQRAIATVLGAVQETVRKSEAVINQTRQSAFSILSGCLSALGKEVASANVGALLREGPKSGFSPMSKDDPPGIGVLKLSAVSRGRLAWKGNTKYAESPERAARQFQLEPGDFLVVRGSGSREIVGSGCRVTEETLPEFDCIFPDLIIRLRADHAKVVPEYLAALWNTAIVRDQIRRVAKSTNGIYKINQTDIRKIRIPLPSIDVQTSIASLIDCISERVFAEESVLDGLLSTRAALAQELLSGRLRLPESLVARFSDTSAAAA